MAVLFSQMKLNNDPSGAIEIVLFKQRPCMLSLLCCFSEKGYIEKKNSDS